MRANAPAPGPAPRPPATVGGSRGVPRPAAALAVALALALLAGCRSVEAAKALRDAQDAFSRGAEAENRDAASAFRALAGLEDPGDDPAARVLELTDRAAAEPSPAQWYRTAAGILDDLDGEDRAALASDGLLGAAVTLRALAAWKLGDRATALDRATEAASLDLGPRDRALVLALPALLVVADAREAVGRAVREEAPDDARAALFRAHRPALADEAIPRLGRAIEAEPEHPVRVFLEHHRLAAYQTLLDVHVRLRGDPGLPDAERRAAAAAADRLAAEPGGAAAAESWRLRLGL